MSDATPDLGPAAREVARLLPGVRAEHLAGPTPCDRYPVAALLDHLLGLSLAFTACARGEPLPDGGEAAPGGSTAERLDPRWRDRLPAALDELARAWSAPGALEGEATAGGVTLPADVMLLVALDELVLHGWDLARATGQPFRCDPASTATVLAFLTASRPDDEPAPEGLFGPVVPVPRGAPALHRALGLAGRDPWWTAPERVPRPV
ncbi:TIGR03086 family metal-binding protein [Vallicoccus soli]|uniref:TIGR03086 family protein n=1 Tax=Vallicoccus soli TaxID=2339232 RepID=A0A3A3YX31_9ACTN|nr:TIGR03086 family metal-binding protein [Vallicoccus soli]RJK94828.1 TIGR03086 family protein [Vallicoccus soli]